MSQHTPQTSADAVVCSFPMAAVADGGQQQADHVVTATLSYQPSEPFAVRASFALPGSATVHWVLARDLLREGVALPSGVGDIRIYPGDEGFLLELRSDNGRAFLYGALEPVIDFVQRIYQAVPDGAEHQHYSFEDELQRLVGVSDQHSSDSAS